MIPTDLTKFDNILSNMATHLIPHKEPTDDSWESINGLFKNIYDNLKEVESLEGIAVISCHLGDQLRYQHSAVVGQQHMYNSHNTEPRKSFLRECAKQYVYIGCYLSQVMITSILSAPE